MNTDELIERLGREATVASPLPAPGMRTAVWVIWAVSYMVVAGVMMLAMATTIVPITPLFLAQQTAAFVTGVIAARAAFASVIPGASDRTWIAPATGAAAWGAVLLWGSVLDLQASGSLGVTSQSDWPCVAAMTVGGLILGAPFVWMLRRGAPLTPGVTACLAAVAALSLANVQACLTRPHAFALTVLVWHGSTVVALTALCALGGHRWFRWPEPAIREE